MDDDKILSRKDAAKFLGVAVITMDTWRARGEGPPYLRVGPRRIAFRQSDLERWLDSQRVATSDGAR